MDGAWPFDDSPKPDAGKGAATPEPERGEQFRLGAGVHQVDGEDYHRDPCPEASLSSTLAKVMLAQSPLHAWTASPRLNPDWEPMNKKTFDIGRAAHRAILGAGGDYVAIPKAMLASNGAASTKEAKAFIEDARASGQTPLKDDEVDQTHAMRAKAHDKLTALQIDLDPARSEMVAVAQIDGVWCRAMIDNVPLDARLPIYDFKTCENASPEACQKAILNYGYDVQAEHYRQVWQAATGEDRVFRFVFQEKSAPHEVCVVELGADTLLIARKKIARAREMWGLCLRAGQWPGYPLGVHRVDLPAWAIERWLERESHEAQIKRDTGRDILAAAYAAQSPDNHEVNPWA
ncbi:hypothetical protein E4191_07745 [Paracoccus liaowanqingii]|uniref:Putative exodeoxyribonuclease 8 PDDEXK-like domain-containing protein n=1 Tax=Paracoccus liaowanqingii TaxID=2560053 RepID=A0A4P7HMQ7_9RHOB|nr:PD-(D/E)XK nuclease-like domain-containing protein [Paracoccus liaowanqingii]QBX34617.1 hypothetical protein E4191_07745 [Paracoccus liaowanqingii]